MGKKMLAGGQLKDALLHYSAAVDGDPSNYQTYYKRATVLLALGKSKSALPDLDKVIEMKPDFNAARLQRGNVKLKQGKLDEASTDFQEVINRDPTNKDAENQQKLIKPLKIDIKEAMELIEDENYNDAIALLTRCIEICPWDPELHEKRAECHIAQGDYLKAINDIRPTTKLRNDNTEGYLKLSGLYYNMGDAEESQIRECLKLDPDHKRCHDHYKKVKKLSKQMSSAQKYINENKWKECIEKSRVMLKTENKVNAYILKAHSHLCHCNMKDGNIKEAFSECNKVLNMDENNIYALCDRGDTYIINEQYEEAVNDYQKANQIDKENSRVHEGLNRAEKLLKQSKKRDYYKILGVKRNANKKEILKSYRQLAAKWHPDKYEGADKKSAEKAFIDIAAAKEVLTDPEKRSKFDNGEDPLDAEEQAQQNHGFHGFNPFESSGFQFNLGRNKFIYPKLDETQLEETLTSGHGPGGQSVNKTTNCVVLRHKPTGLFVKCHESRDLNVNKKLARIRLQEKLDLHQNKSRSLQSMAKKDAARKRAQKVKKTNERLQKLAAFKEREGLS
ncbi:DgyrCDS8498 [Dimorphilus gyrociliatus]|uniref:DgyrCDS8498 n=1 Tax=Dimorphilus gyrociliatus TaxID=2664684 RepID=A0A7I8VUB6_9ANNE|nr:DgyrCDS8498 [Dimorphilus gyrociliatus]